MRISMVIPVLLLLGVVACSGDPTGSARPVPISFSAAAIPSDSVAFYRTQHETGAVAPVVVSVQGGVLRVSGYFETLCAKETLEGSATRDGDQLVLQIRALERNPDLCLTSTEAYRYEATFQSLAAGSYQLTVRHERDARHPENIVLQQQITVP